MQLKPHQITGAQWLASKRHALLADQPRVGKTLTALTAAKYADARRILIVCPAIARLNWAREVAHSFGPVSTITTGAELKAAERSFARTGVTITSYGLVPNQEAAPWDLLISDESHFLRNRSSGRTKKMLGTGGLIHRALRAWLLSGTPAVNHAAELWPVLRVFGIYRDSYEKFVREFCTSYTGPYGQVITGSKNHEALRTLMAPIYLRRTLAEVAPDLDPIEFEEYALDGAAVAFPAYEVSLVEAALASPDPAAALETVGPATATLRRLAGVSKAPLAIELLRSELLVGTYKLVVFAVHREVVVALANGLSAFYPAVVNGAVSGKDRDEAVRRFQTDPTCRVFIGNVQSAGTAIDLSMADEAVFVESAWTPADNEQAAMRIQNIESKTPKFVRFLGLGGTIDEKIQRVNLRKTADLSAIFDKQEAPCR